MIADYYDNHGSYPETLSKLDASAVAKVFPDGVDMMTARYWSCREGIRFMSQEDNPWEDSNSEECMEFGNEEFDKIYAVIDTIRTPSEFSIAMSGSDTIYITMPPPHLRSGWGRPGSR